MLIKANFTCLFCINTMTRLSHFKLRKEQKAQVVASEQLKRFAEALDAFLQQIENNYSEEEQKNFLQRFLETTFYAECVLPGAKTTKKSGAYDLVIYPTPEQENIEVLIEVKSSSNTAEMITPNDLNRKALQQLIVYYLRERITNQNKSLRHLIVTNLYTFFSFDAAVLYNTFYPQLEKEFQEIEAGQRDISKNHNVYTDFASPAIEKVKTTLSYDYIDLREYRNDIQEVLNGKENKALADLYKFFSSTHLLKQTIQSDPNQLDRRFYNELLYLLGLEEQKGSGNKTLIARAKTPNYASLVEQTYIKVELAFEHFTHREQYGTTPEEQKFNITLELVITWLNRLLFLKLLETQLLNYNAGNSAYQFLNKEKIRDFATLNNLFFAVLAIPVEQRSGAFKERFGNVPYLNSSLFEETELEHEVKISGLESQQTLPLYKQSVLKKEYADRPEVLPIFDYLFAFLDAYDFGSLQEEEAIQSKTLINASVLGLIFEKINGHKDGAVFTPSYITAYICRETIERAIIDKFNTQYNWQCVNIPQLYNQLDGIDKQEANRLFNTITICDPAVGSGHFLVSALNELIYLKHRLGILQDESGISLRRTDYEFEIVNDELVVTAEGDRFRYNPRNSESQRVQETLFSEKRHLIEHCLFGVDINPTSVQICRLRLWIELLKHAYYTRESAYQALEALPNIDLNIKCGNAVVYSLPLQGKWVAHNSQQIRALTSEYYETSDKSRKRAIALAIEEYNNTLKNELWEEEKKAAQAHAEECEKEIATLSQRLKEARNNAWNVYDPTKIEEQLNEAKALHKQAQQALEVVEKNRATSRTFEWRLEFPEVWGANGEFVGFDIVMGNPPYISAPEQVAIPALAWQRQAIIEGKNYQTLYQKWDLYIVFFELGLQLLRKGGYCAMIIPYPFANQNYALRLREYLLQAHNLFLLADLSRTKVFISVTVSNCIPFVCKEPPKNEVAIAHLYNGDTMRVSYHKSYDALCENKIWNLTQPEIQIKTSGRAILGDICYISVGMVLNSNEKTAKGQFTKEELISNTKDALHPREYIDAKDLESYRITRIRYLEYNTPRSPKLLRRPTFPELYLCNKLMFNRLGRMQVYLDIEHHFLHSDTIYSAVLWHDLRTVNNASIQNVVKRFSHHSRAEMELLSQKVDLRFLLGVLNSSYVAELLQRQRGGSLNIYPEHLRHLPIPLVSKEQQAPIIALVEQIIECKKNAPQEDISALQKKIDALVYNLYNLSDSDTAIIENSAT